MTKPITEPATLTSASYEELVRETLVRLGEDPEREGLASTPERVHKAETPSRRAITKIPKPCSKAHCSR